MASSRIATGIDVGTYQVKVVVARQGNSPFPKVIGTGYAESKGLQHGYIVNVDDVTRSIKTAVAQAESTAGVRIKNAFLAVGGIGLDEVRGRGEAIIARADAEGTNLDMEKGGGASRGKV